MLTLNATVLQQSDNKALVFTDSTGTSAPGGWGYDTNPDVTTITTNGSDPKLELQITVKRNDETTIYDYIDLGADSDFGGPYTTPDELVFTITPLKLLINGVVKEGVTSDSELEDGIYECIYVYGRDTVEEATTTIVMCVEGVIRNKVYDRLRIVPDIYNSYNNQSKEISDTLLMFCMLKSIESMAYVALQDKILNTLDALEKIYNNGTNYTWQQ